MALRNQPYIPLYVQDFQTDEKLIECSAQATGVYIRIMCVLHKSEKYGTFLLKQNDKQNSKQTFNFALKLAKYLPYDFATIESSLDELIEAGVLKIDGDTMYQKRMVKDGEVSDKRSLSGFKGGEQTAKRFAKAKVKANGVANSENEIEYESEVNTEKEETEKPQPKSSIEYDFAKIKNELKENQYTTKQFVIQQYKLTEAQYFSFVDTFVGEKDNDLHKPLDEVNKHFKNWCRINHVKLKKDFTEVANPKVAHLSKKMIY